MPPTIAPHRLEMIIYQLGPPDPRHDHVPVRCACEFGTDLVLFTRTNRRVYRRCVAQHAPDTARLRFGDGPRQCSQEDAARGYLMKFESLRRSPTIEGRGKLRLAQRGPHRSTVMPFVFR